MIKTTKDYVTTTPNLDYDSVENSLVELKTINGENKKYNELLQALII